MKYQVTNSVSSKQLQEIQSWLIKANKKGQTNFLSNWHIIKKHIENKLAYIMLIGGKIAAYCIWQGQSKRIRIQILEVNPNLRGKGIGQAFVTILLEKFREIHLPVVDLECMPAESIDFWKKCGFIEFPKSHLLGQPACLDEFSREGVRLYQTLLSTVNKPNFNISAALKKERIELWPAEPNQVEKNIEPAWAWELHFKVDSDVLQEPIFFPCKQDWQICWRRGRVVLFQGKTKAFPFGQIYNDDFLFIDQLPWRPLKSPLEAI